MTETREKEMNMEQKDELLHITLMDGMVRGLLLTATRTVAEAAALLSAGEDAQLILPKQKGRNYTLAAAVPAGTMQAHGHIEIVGAGPGDPELIALGTHAHNGDGLHPAEP